MTASEIAAHLLGNCGSLQQFEVYMFGSTLHGIGEDIDILVVGPAGDVLSKLKQELRAASEFLPLHILCMLPSEERHTEFVTRERCVQLKELATRRAYEGHADAPPREGEPGVTPSGFADRGNFKF